MKVSNSFIRHAVYAKYNGLRLLRLRDDYKDMQVDHIKPKCRNNETTALKYGMLTEMEWDGNFILKDYDFRQEN